VFLLFSVIGAISQSSYVWMLLCQCYLHTHRYSDAEHCANEALKSIIKETVHEKLQNLVLTFLVKSLSLQNEEEKLRGAVEKCTEVRLEHLSVIYNLYVSGLVVRVYRSRGRFRRNQIF
jgi:hypothetical protein